MYLGQLRPHRRQRLPGHAHPLGEGLRGPDPGGRLAAGDQQRRGEHPGHAALTQVLRQVAGGAFGDHLMVEQRQPVPQPLDALQEPDQPRIVQGLQGSVLDQLDQVIEVGVQRVERLLELVWIPDLHDHILLEQTFDYKQGP